LVHASTVAIFEQTTSSLRDLTKAIEGNADVAAIRVAYVAVIDQCSTAVRLAKPTEIGSSERFEALAAATSAEAFAPTIEALTDGRDPQPALLIPKQTARWIGLALDAHVRGDQETVDQCFLLAAALVDRSVEDLGEDAT
jgi:hypothetical protein